MQPKKPQRATLHERLIGSRPERPIMKPAQRKAIRARQHEKFKSELGEHYEKMLKVLGKQALHNFAIHLGTRAMVEHWNDIIKLQGQKMSWGHIINEIKKFSKTGL